MLIDCHSHHKIQNENIYRLYSLSREEILKKNHWPDCSFVAGIHPWWIPSSIQIQDLLDCFKSDNCIGVGEFGLDKVKNSNWIDQLKTCHELLDFYQNLPQAKIAVCHNVRASSELLEIFKQHRLQKPVILHDINGNVSQIKSFCRYPVYFSVGSKIFDSNTTIAKNITSLPLERLLCETDESHQSLESIYQHVADCLNIDVMKLEEQLEANFLQALGQTRIR